VSLARPAAVPLAPLAGSSLPVRGIPPAPLGPRPATPLAGGPRPAVAPRPPSRAGISYRGLPEPIRIVGWVAIAVAIGGVLGATGPTAFDRISAVAAVKPGLLAWYCVRALGFLAYLVLAGSVLYGLLLSTKILDAIAHRPVSFALHKDLAIVALILGTAHGLMLTLDQSFSFTPFAILVPFESPYSPISVGVGQLALYLSAIVTASFYVRRRIGQRTWRLIHYLTFLVFIGSSAHGIFSGSDSGTPWAFWLYLLPVTAAVFLTTYRIVISVAARTSQPQVERAGVPGAFPAPRGPLDRPGARPGATSGGSPWPM
jgi:DMSO/TMAO reductase YedYZ heme-binding membrane subunit